MNGLKQLLGWLKWLVAIAVIGGLCYLNRNELAKVGERSIRYPIFLGGFVVAFCSISLTFVRWHLLVTALKIPFTLAAAFRVSFLGYMLATVNGVGGDLVKAGWLAHGQTERRTTAVATVFLDRLLGLLALFWTGSLAAFFVGESTPQIQYAIRGMWVISGLGIAGIGLMMWPAFTRSSFVRLFTRLPKVGGLVHELIESIGLYQDKPLVIVLAILISLAGHFGMISSFYICAVAIHQGRTIPSYFEHLSLIPLAELIGFFTVTGGLEASVGELYVAALPATATPELIQAARSDGLLTGVAYRVATLGVAAVGALYYFASRAEVRTLIQEAEAEADAEAQPAPNAEGS